MYTYLLISFVVSCTCLGCYLYPSSGAQLPRTAMVVYLSKTEVLVSSGVDVYFVGICVYSFLKASHHMFVLVCVSLDLFWYCVVMMCGFLCCICVFTVVVCYSTGAGTESYQLSALPTTQEISYKCVKASRVSGWPQLSCLSVPQSF
jgi:hypothetical protein